MRVILASTSPRRRLLFEQLRIPFDVATPQCDEIAEPGETPEAQACRLALEKARSVRASHAVVLGSDTIVVLDDQSIGKPANPEDATKILGRLRGRTHRVVTAVACLAPGHEDRVFAEVATVRMRDISDAEIAAYVATGEPLDKAGAYAVQGEGARFIEAIEGDRSTVIGLPLTKTVEVLRELGLFVPDVAASYAGGS